MLAHGRRARPARAALPHRQPDLRHLRLRGLRPPADRRCTPQVADEHGIQLPELDLGGGYGIAYTTEHTRCPRRELGEQHGRHRAPRAQGRRRRRPGTPCPRISIEPGRAIAGPSTFTLYEVGTVKEVDLGGGATRTYVSRRRRHERQRPHRALRRRLLLHAGQPPLRRRRRGCPAWSGKHCESGDIVVMDEYLPGRRRARATCIAVPGTGAYCRVLSSQYNHTPRPPVVAVRDGRRGSSSAARPSTTCWPSTSADGAA